MSSLPLNLLANATMPQLSTESDSEYYLRCRAMSPGSMAAEIEANAQEEEELVQSLANMRADSVPVDTEVADNVRTKFSMASSLHLTFADPTGFSIFAASKLCTGLRRPRSTSNLASSHCSVGFSERGYCSCPTKTITQSPESTPRPVCRRSCCGPRLRPVPPAAEKPQLANGGF
jgi:hypothetical protein